MTRVAIKDFTRSKTPSHPYERVARAILPAWDISLVFCGRTRAKRLNKQLRNKTYVPNVLSYRVGEKSGEILICKDVLTRQAKTYEMSARTFVLFLFIHGLLHLKGHAHGTTMERSERTWLARFTR